MGDIRVFNLTDAHAADLPRKKINLVQITNRW